jgi:hypothetical protein
MAGEFDIDRQLPAARLCDFVVHERALLCKHGEAISGKSLISHTRWCLQEAANQGVVVAFGLPTASTITARDCRRLVRSIRHANGSNTFAPAILKSRMFLVTTVNPWTSAVAAIKLSLIGKARPERRSRASSSAQRRPVRASHGTQAIRATPASNQASSRRRRRP